MPIASSTASITGTCGARVSGTSSLVGSARVLLGDPVRLVGGDQLHPPLRAPVRVHAGHQVLRPVVLDQPVDEVQQPADRVDGRAVRRLHGVRDAEIGAGSEAVSRSMSRPVTHRIRPHGIDSTRAPGTRCVTRIAVNPATSRLPRLDLGRRRLCPVPRDERYACQPGLEAEHLFKVFGRRPDEAVKRLREGADRAELRADGTTAAVIDASFRVEPARSSSSWGCPAPGSPPCRGCSTGCWSRPRAASASTART